MRIIGNQHAVASRKCEQGQASLARTRQREAGWHANRRHDGDARSHRLFDQFLAAPRRKQRETGGGIDALPAHRADQFVERIVPPDILGTVPVVDSLPVTTYPEHAGTRRARVVCARWLPRTDDAGAQSAVVVTDTTPPPGAALAQADGDGPAVDAVALSGGALLVRSVALGGSDSNSEAGPLFLLADSGVLFGVENADAARRLGFSLPGSPIPWVFLAGLPRGPELSVRAASVGRDVILAGP